MISLKTQNLPSIILYLLVNLGIFIVLYRTNTVEVDSFRRVFQDLSKKDGIIFILLPIILFILSGIIPASWKEVFVFWRIKSSLPGCYAFSRYAKEDDRINIELLKSKYGKFPRKASEQNSLWYGIYKNIKNDKGIDKTNKDFLLARELTIMTIIFILISIPTLLFFTNIWDNNKNNLWFYILFLLGEYLIIRLIARNHAERLVTNVLAYESSRLHNEKYTNGGQA